MVQINGKVPEGAEASLTKAVADYAQANPAIGIAPDVTFTVRGKGGDVTVKGAFQRIGAQLIFILAREVVRAVASKLSRRQRTKEQKRHRHLPPQMGGGMPSMAADGAQESPEQKFNELKALGMVRQTGKDGWEMAGKPPLKFADKAALLAHLGGAPPEPAPKKAARAAKKAARKVAKVAKKTAKTAQKAARKR